MKTEGIGPRLKLAIDAASVIVTDVWVLEDIVSIDSNLFVNVCEFSGSSNPLVDTPTMAGKQESENYRVGVSMFWGEVGLLVQQRRLWLGSSARLEAEAEADPTRLHPVVPSLY